MHGRPKVLVDVDGGNVSGGCSVRVTAEPYPLVTELRMWCDPYRMRTIDWVSVQKEPSTEAWVPSDGAGVDLDAAYDLAVWDLADPYELYYVSTGHGVANTAVTW